MKACAIRIFARAQRCVSMRETRSTHDQDATMLAREKFI
jgi:hypothetical protein